MVKSIVSQMKVSELATKLGGEINTNVAVTEDPLVTVVEYGEHTFAFHVPISNCVFAITDTEIRNAFVHSVYENIDNAIHTVLTKRGWTGKQNPHLSFGQSVNGRLFVINCFGSWDLRPIPVVDLTDNMVDDLPKEISIEELVCLDEEHRNKLDRALEAYSWQSLALNGFRVKAVAKYREEKNTSLTEAKTAVDSFIESNQ